MSNSPVRLVFEKNKGQHYLKVIDQSSKSIPTSGLIEYQQDLESSISNHSGLSDFSKEDFAQKIFDDKTQCQTSEDESESTKIKVYNSTIK